MYLVFYLAEVQQNSARNIEISEFLEDLKELGIGGITSSNGDSQTEMCEPVHSQSTETSSDVAVPIKAHLEWVPLELCYGIPLFSSEANESVCAKVCHFIFLKVHHHNYVYIDQCPLYKEIPLYCIIM